MTVGPAGTTIVTGIAAANAMRTAAGAMRTGADGTGIGMSAAADTPTVGRIATGIGGIRVGRVVGGRTGTMTVGPAGTTIVTGIAAANATRTGADGTGTGADGTGTGADGTGIGMSAAADTPTVGRIATGIGGIRVGRVVGGRTGTMTVGPAGTTIVTGIAAANATRTGADGTGTGMSAAADTPTVGRIATGIGGIRVGRVVGGRTGTMTVGPAGTTIVTGIAAANAMRTAAGATGIGMSAAADTPTVGRIATGIGGIRVGRVVGGRTGTMTVGPAGTTIVTGIAAANATRTGADGTGIGMSAAADTPTDATTGAPTLPAADVIRSCRIQCPKRISMPSRAVDSIPFRRTTRNVLRVILFTLDRCSTSTLSCLMSMLRRPIVALRAWT